MSMWVSKEAVPGSANFPTGKNLNELAFLKVCDEFATIHNKAFLLYPN
jgi:hypothetical protein